MLRRRTIRLKVNHKPARRIVVAGSFMLAGLFVYLQFSYLRNALAAATNYYTLNDGEWKSSVWSNISENGAACNCNPGCNFNTGGTFYITKKIYSSMCGTLTISGGGIGYVNGAGRLIINGDFTISGGSSLTISTGDSVIVNGNLTVSGGSQVVVNGYFRINGSPTLTGNSTVCGPGVYSYSGTISGSGWCPPAPMPVELMYFNTVAKRGRVALTWQTASEKDNDYFLIERSADAKKFEVIAKVKGAGTSAVIRNYSFTDEMPPSGRSYYRLKQVDFNGQFSYSKMQTIFLEKNADQTGLKLISIYPNPFAANFNIAFESPRSGTGYVIIQAPSGEMMLRRNIEVSEGNNIYVIENGSFMPGLYLVTVLFDGKKFSEKVAKF